MMTTDTMAKLKRSLVRHEGFKKFPYLDTSASPKITIGIGFNLSDRGIDDEWINKQYLEDVNYFYSQLATFPWFKNLNDDRQIVLIDMCFMGWKKFLEFENMITALEWGNYKQAALEMLDSEWATQTKNRATELAHAMLTGVYDI